MLRFRLLQQCLVLPDCLLTAIGSSKVPVVRYNIRQYFSLLAMHWDSEEVQTVLAKIPSPEILRRGIAASHPVLAYTHELQRIIATQKENPAQGGDEVARESDVAVALLAQKSLAAVYRGQLLRRQARGKLEEGDAFGAIQDLTTALSMHCDNPYDQESEDEQDEDADDDDEESTEQRKTRGFLPRYLRTLLLVER